MTKSNTSHTATSPATRSLSRPRRFVASWSRWLIAGILALTMVATGSRVQAAVPGGPEISVFKGDSVTGTELADDTGTVDLGSVYAGNSSAPQTITIKNTGTSDLTGLALTKMGPDAADFTVSALGATTVAAGATTTFTVTFTPSAVGTRTAKVSIDSSDADENPFEIAVTGSGMANSPPMITSNGGGATAMISVPENTTGVTTVIAVDMDLPAQTITYSKSGSDAALFNIDSGTGALTFVAAPDFETNAGPFSITVTATDSGTPAALSDSQDLSISVTNKNEVPTFALSGTNPRHLYQTSGAQSTSGFATGMDDGDSTVAQTLTFSCSNNLNGLFSVQPTINSSTGELSYTLSGTSGIATVSVKLTDDQTINGDSALFIEKSFTITVDPAPDYTVATVGGVITVTDQSNNSDTLSISEPAAGSIQFSSSGRTFSVNGALNTTGNSDNVTLTGITSLIVNTAAGSDTINIGAFGGTSFPSLRINGGIGNDTVNLTGDIVFAANASLDLDLQNDEAAPGEDTANVAANANLITTGTGAITVKVSRDIVLNAGSSLETVNGGITLEANQQATPTTGSFTGIKVYGGTIKTSGTGALALRGKSGLNTTTFVFGTIIYSNGRIESTSSAPDAGTIDIIGQCADGGTDAAYGVSIEGAATAISSAAGHIHVTGSGGNCTGQPTVTNSLGLRVVSAGKITATGNADITLDATSGTAAAGSSHAIIVSDASTAITAVNGNIAITATGGSANAATGNNSSLGLWIARSALIATAGTGSITVDATSGNVVSGVSYAMRMDDAFTAITAVNGNIAITATSGSANAATGLGTCGLYLTSSGARIATTGTGSISASGSAGSSSSVGAAQGVRVDAPAQITSTSGNITLTGNGGTGTGILNHGASIRGNVTATSTGNITINGIAGPPSAVAGNGSQGVQVRGGAVVSSAGGNVTLNGTSANTIGNEGISIAIAGTGTVSIADPAHSITAVSDSIFIDATNGSFNAGTGTVTLRQKTNGTLINLGAADSTSTLGLTDAELDRITAGTLNIGDSSSGTITLSAPISPANTSLVNLITGASINNTNSGTALTVANSTSTGTMAPGGSPGTFSIAGQHTLKSGSTFAVELASTSSFDKLSATTAVNIGANVTLSVSSISGFVATAGDSFVIIDRTGGTGTFAGLAEGAIVSSNFLSSGLPARISYVGGTGDDVVITTDSPEIQIQQPLTILLTDGSASVGFGSIDFGSSSAAKIFTITNKGTSALHLGALTKTGHSADFIVAPTSLATTLEPNTTITFTVTFTPTVGGARAAAIHLASDDIDENPFDIDLTGTGLVVAPVPFTINGAPKHIVTNEGATDATGAADGTQFDILGRGGYLAANGTLGVPGTLKIGVGGVTEVPNNFQAYWKDDGTGLKRLVRSGDVAPGTGGALFNSIPTIPVPGLNPQGVVTLLSALRIGSGGVTSADDSAMWSEVGGNGLQLLMRENDPVPGISGATVSSFGFGCYATANTGATTGEAVFAIKMKGATLDSALLRQSITGPGAATVSIVAREKTAAPGAGGELFGALHSTLGAATRMDTLGNIVFEGQIKPSGKYGIWYQPVAGSLSKVFIAGEAAPGTSSATFSTFEMPSMGSAATFAFVGYLNADGDNTANDKNNGVWRGTVAGGINPIIRRGDAALPGMIAGSKVGHLWSGWLNQNNRGAWRGWVDTAGDGVSAFPDDTYGIYTDAGGTMRLLLSVNDVAPGTGGATLASVDHPVISGATAGNEHVAFIGTLSGAGVTAGNAKAIWRSDNGGTPVLLLRTGDSMTTSKGDKIVANIDMPGTTMDIRPWELPVMDNNGRVLMVITFTDGTSAQVIAP